MWFLLSAFSGLASAFDKVLNRIALGNRSNSLAYSVIYLSLAALLSFPFALPINLSFSTRTTSLIIWTSVVWAASSATMFAAHINTHVSLSTILSKTRILWVIPFSFLLLGEKITPATIIGIFIIFLGLSALFVKNDLHKSRDVHLVLISSIFSALGSVLNALLVRESLTPGQVTFIMMAGSASVLFVILIIRGKFIPKLISVLKYSWYLTLLATALEAFAYTLLNKAYSIGPTSRITAVYMAMSIVVVWIGVIFLNEKDNLWKKVISSMIVTAGVVILKLAS